MRTIVGLWRWRGNPLCRRTDRGEAWLTLWATVLIVVGAPLAGLLTAQATHETLLRSAQEQQRERQRVWATAERVAVRPSFDNSDPESVSRRPTRARVTARWTAPDGRQHSATFTVRHHVRQGGRIPVWIDRAGRLTSRPMSTRGASSHALLAGAAVGACAGGGLEVARRLGVRLLLRRRYARWDEEWARIGPDWGRAGTGP
ncbi:MULTISPECIES: hypothetical protein [Streptomyces]|uniref:Uncharacterized protein n=1 Tax=Streptomyces cacaoi TaxID=1898 RepID=A0A4Y3QSX5_STRCI|nr:MULTISPECIES: hypothetical protein [Streptomyces]NNG89522.1 hypothetical protein [Streptomyces cacaoi]QHF94936.1 hypothetical protein DEH18_14945 [Streptomyces sp. NHF165]GEB48312.1 hypothetical protein SCA03_08630 [Streptomyces cacaoi]